MEKSKEFILWVAMILSWLAALMLTLKWAGVTLEPKQVFALYCLFLVFRFKSNKPTKADKAVENIFCTALFMSVAGLVMKFA